MNCPTCNSTVAPGVTFCPECGTRLNQPSQPLRVLQERYELTKKLGEGGMGAVYLASDRRLRTVRWAVKEMSDAAITSPLERQQASDAFQHEAELLARLAHPNLPRVTDHFTQDGKNYLVMEFVPGETVLAYVQRLGAPRPLDEVLEWAHQLCDVLNYLHAQQPPVIFRDLKPANVMLTPERTLKLIDFGIARLFKPGQSKDTQAYGTMGYSAPEQYGRGQTDARSDVYSLGVLIHQLLTNYDPTSTPFRLPLADQLNPAVPAALGLALNKATNPDAEQRFASMAEFRQALLGSGNLVQRQSLEEAARLAAFSPTVATSGSQPSTSSPPPPTPPAPAKTTGLARTGFWIALSSVLLMLPALALMAAGAQSGDTDNGLLTFGGLLAFLGVLGGAVAATLGLVALFRPATAQSRHGRRDAAVALAAGLLAVPLCCVVFSFYPNDASSDESDEGRLPASYVQHAPQLGTLFERQNS